MTAVEVARGALDDRELPVIDFASGVLATRVPPLAAPVFLRLAPPASALVDEARAAYLLAAAPALRAARAGWREGPGVAVEPGGDRDLLGEEVHQVGLALRALGDERVARSYLELTQPRVPAASGRDAD
jgi:hypothetical protein